MKQIVLKKPENVIHMNENLDNLIIIASSCAENKNKWHPYGMIIKMPVPETKYNVIRYDGAYQFRNEGYDSIRELIEAQTRNHWKFYAI